MVLDETEALMTHVILDPTMVQQLRQAQAALKLVDADGNVIGHFIPEDSPPTEPYISEEELDRRELEEGGKRLADILADLEKRA